MIIERLVLNLVVKLREKRNSSQHTFASHTEAKPGMIQKGIIGSNVVPNIRGLHNVSIQQDEKRLRSFRVVPAFLDIDRFQLLLCLFVSIDMSPL
ncbi:hypothetical protein TNCV_948351 [Trichonephila clavipes]|nr:hypothetical protein TNCV_948351 [Trichonephila clavipes]